jgi:toxin CcdB
MRQFDVYPNPSNATSNAYPYIVDIQSPVIAELATRIVVPLGSKQRLRDKVLKGLTLTITYDGEELLLLVPQIASVPSKTLKNPIGSLSHLRDEIIAALDFAITGI